MPSKILSPRGRAFRVGRGAFGREQMIKESRAIDKPHCRVKGRKKEKAEKRKREKEGKSRRSRGDSRIAR